MDICLGCEIVEGVEGIKSEEINYTICDECRNGVIGDISEEETVKKARLVYENGMKWDDVLSFFDLTILELEDQIVIFEKLGVPKFVITEMYKSWEGSNDGA